MGRFVLVYEIQDYDEPGKKAETFTNEEKLHIRVNELATEHYESFEIEFAGYLQYEFEYKPEKVFTKYIPKKL